MKIRFLAAALFVTLLSGEAFAQTGAPTEQKEVPALPTDRWPPTDSMPRSGKLVVVTEADPMHRHTCRVKAIEAGQVLCARRLGRAPLVYRQAEVVALLDPGWNDNGLTLRFLAVGSALAAGLICTGVFAPVSLTASIVLEAFGGFAELDTLGLAAFTDHSSQGETVAYLRPGTQLTVKPKR